MRVTFFISAATSCLPPYAQINGAMFDARKPCNVPAIQERLNKRTNDKASVSTWIRSGALTLGSIGFF